MWGRGGLKFVAHKKTLVKDKDGFFLNPAEDPNLQTLEFENIELRKKVRDYEHLIADLKSRLEESETKREHANKTIQKFEDELIIKQENIETRESDVKKHLKTILKRKR